MADCLTREEVLHVERLARIELTEDEIEKYRYQLKTLMDEVDKIKSVELKDDERLIAPTSETAVLREDVIEESVPIEDLLANSDDTEDREIVVPKVVGGEN